MSCKEPFEFLKLQFLPKKKVTSTSEAIGNNPYVIEQYI